MVNDAELRAMLAGTSTGNAEETIVTNAADATTTPAATDVPATTANSNPLLTELATMGVKDVSDLKGLASDALDGRAHLTERRAYAIKLAGVAFNGADAANAAVMASTTTYLNSAPLEIVNASIDNYRQSMKAQGLTEDKGRQSAPAATAFAASVEEVDGDRPKAPATSHAATTYGNHPFLTGGK